MWRGVAIAAICLLAAVSVFCAVSLGAGSAPAAEEPVTLEGGADYIPPEDRIAVFDPDGTLVTRMQGQTDGLDYVFDENDQLVLGGVFVTKNLKMNKVSMKNDWLTICGDGVTRK